MGAFLLAEERRELSRTDAVGFAKEEEGERHCPSVLAELLLNASEGFLG